MPLLSESDQLTVGRRAVVGLAAGGLAGVAGCVTRRTETDDPGLGERESISVVGVNNTATDRQLQIHLQRDGEELFDESVTVLAESDTNITEFEEAGSYRLTAETASLSTARTLKLSIGTLTDCNDTTVVVAIDSEEIEIAVRETTMLCN